MPMQQRYMVMGLAEKVTSGDIEIVITGTDPNDALRKARTLCPLLKAVDDVRVHKQAEDGTWRVVSGGLLTTQKDDVFVAY